MPSITKTRRSGFQVKGSWSTSNRFSGEVPYPVPAFQPTTIWADTRTGVNNPGWRDKIRRGVDATTDMDGILSKVIEYKPGSYEVCFLENVPPYGNIEKSYKFKGCQQGIVITDIAPSSISAEQRALMTLYKRIRANHQKFSGLTFLGELRQAISMVKRPAASLRKGLDNYVEVLKKRSRGIPFTDKGNRVRKRILADSWLEYSFGWTPLISDVKSGAEALAAWHVGKDGLDERRNRISATGEDLSATLQTAYGLVDPYFSKVRLVRDLSAKGRTTVRYIVRLSYKTAVPKESAKRLAQLSGFSLMEFIPTAWELVPWSFLVDYFSNVGDVLEAFATPVDDIYSITRTIRRVTLQNYSVRIDVSSTASQVGYRFYREDGDGTSNWKSTYAVVQRRAISSLSLPRLEMENPFGKNPVRRLLNMTSLGAGMRSIKPFYR